MTSDTASQLRFGWFIPTIGDTSAFGDPNATMKPSLELFTDIAVAAEAAGFEYTLVPVQTMCYEAWVTCAMVAARTTRLKQLIAVRAGYMLPAQLAKMFTTFDKLTEGRVYANLIAGPGGGEQAADGLFYAHDERYEVMDETVTLMKRLWTEDEPVTHHGKHFQIENGIVRPRPYQRPHPPFYIGGTSPAAKDVGAKHADVYLFWGDRPENIVKQIDEVRSIAQGYGRDQSIKFGMRLQVVVRETEEEAWEAAEAIIEGAPKILTDAIKNLWSESQANTRMKELGKAKDYRIDRHLWSGLTTIRTGAGVAIVGNPRQVADTLQEFIDIGCTEFCLSGYPHAAEAERFGKLVMPLFEGRITSEPLVASATEPVPTA
ncbi:MAG: LLM class flavin-dependent oxidoreductase [Chloroflexi bacterium]|nr:LLM class flavin-dependent oxidoreductase [Chloroflexota bacterium]